MARQTEMKQIEKKVEEILSEKRFREKTMGCFYQSELRKHDRAQRKALQDTREEVLEEMEHILGMWVSSEYTASHYEDECISPKMFWHEWSKTKDYLLDKLTKKK